MIYSIVRYYVERGENTLIVVPTTSLVEQMYKDFGIMDGTLFHFATKFTQEKNERQTLR